MQRVVRQTTAELARRRAARQHAALDELAQQKVRAVNVSGRPALAHIAYTFQADAHMADRAAEVADALERNGVAYFVTPAEADRRRVVVVCASAQREAMRALRTQFAGRGVYAATVNDAAVGRAKLIESGIGRTASSLRVFQFVVTPGGVVLGGPELGCDLQFWPATVGEGLLNSSGEPIPTGSLLNPQPSPFTPSVIPPTELTTSLRPIDGRLRPVPAGLAPTHVFHLTEPIDAVYTWVDGGDPAWQERKAIAWKEASAASALHPLAANDSRYVSRDELKYSLRSLDMFASWIRQIFIVSDDQTPAWLDVEHPRITLVSHKQLFGDRGRLPTFNSHAIESQLHRIEGLSEHFLYINDDVFFGRPVSPSSFVLSNGITKFFLSTVKVTPGPRNPTDLPVTSAAKNQRDLLLEHFGRTVTDKFQHAPHALRRSVLADLERAFPEAIARTASTQFRSASDVSVPSAFGHYFAYLTGRAIPGQMDYQYLDIAAADIAERLEVLLRNRAHEVFCLNDHDSSHVDQAVQSACVRRFLEQYFPLPSQFERDQRPASSNEPRTGR